MAKNSSPRRQYILAVTGPSGVGKSTVARQLEKLFSDYVQRVPIVTTRAPKTGDEDEYVYVGREQFESMCREGEMIAYTSVASSSEHRRYGYTADAIERIWMEKKIPLVITEQRLLQSLADHFGRRQILSCGLLPPGRSRRMMLSILLHRLRSRGRETDAQIDDRLRNATDDLAFFKERRDLFNLYVTNDDLEQACAMLGMFLKEHCRPAPERVSG